MLMMLGAGPADAHDAGRARDAWGLARLMLMMLAVPLEPRKAPAQLMLMMLAVLLEPWQSAGPADAHVAWGWPDFCS